MRKVTNAQLDLLTALAERDRWFADHYPPVRWAVENGYAIWREVRHGDVLSLTPAGRAVLKEQHHD